MISRAFFKLKMLNISVIFMKDTSCPKFWTWIWFIFVVTLNETRFPLVFNVWEYNFSPNITATPHPTLLQTRVKWCGGILVAVWWLRWRKNRLFCEESRTPKEVPTNKCNKKSLLCTQTLILSFIHILWKLASKYKQNAEQKFCEGFDFHENNWIVT